MNKDLIIKDMKDIASVFKKHNVIPYLSFGALLGAVRDKDFIEYDDDVDFDVIDAITYKQRKDIGWALFDLGFKQQKIAFNIFGRMEVSEVGYNGDEHTGIIVCERNFKFSIFFYKKIACEIHGEEYVCVPKYGGLPLISIPAMFYEKTDTIKLHKEKFATPSPQKEYLSYVYGDDWKKPKQNAHASQFQQAHEGKQLLEDILPKETSSE